MSSTLDRLVMMANQIGRFFTPQRDGDPGRGHRRPSGEVLGPAHEGQHRRPSAGRRRRADGPVREAVGRLKEAKREALLKPADDLTIVFDQAARTPSRARPPGYIQCRRYRHLGLLPGSTCPEERARRNAGRPAGSMWGGCCISPISGRRGRARQALGNPAHDQAEAYARERGCHAVQLDTHSFQARPFYERRGYELFATLDDYPKGHKNSFSRRNCRTTSRLISRA